MLNGEPGGDRTHDHLIKSQMLYQLSYRPKQRGDFIRESFRCVNLFFSLLQ